MLRQPLPAGSVTRWLTAEDVGTELWWQRIRETGTPLMEQAENRQVNMHFFWRDPQGKSSSIQRVYIDIGGVVDHHSIDPESLRRVPDTDVWHWSVEIEDDWRGSYCLIPAGEDSLPPPFSKEAEARRLQQRAWWISLMPLAIADPLNPLRAFRNSRRFSRSAAQTPNAPVLPVWQAWDRHEPLAEPATPQRLTWQSALLGNQRRVWLWASDNGVEPQQRPLVILLDGQNWAEGQPIFAALAAETAAGRLPPACWLMIDAINGQHREAELPCNPRFWQAVSEELIPLAAQQQPFSQAADRTLVAGQSYGGLAALYAGLHFPQRFGRILTQSGSFWWPNLNFIHDFAGRDRHQPGLLLRQLAEGKLPKGRLRIFQEAGRRERNIAFVNQQLAPALEAAGHQLHFRLFSGGHDGLCWRDGLIDGCRWLLADLLPPSSLPSGDVDD